MDQGNGVVAEVRDGTYGDAVATVEPGGAEFIPLSERHGETRTLFGTWTSPNLEFATVFVGVIAVSFFGQSFWDAVLAIVVGTALGSVAHSFLCSRGPEFGVPQMVQSRISFGFIGNILPAGLNSVTAGIGWFAVNSVSGALALNALLGVNDWVCLAFVGVAQTMLAFYGHNLIQLFERWMLPLLGVAFAIASVVIISKSHPGAVHTTQGLGGFLLSVGASFGYACGWNPFGSDFTRYFKPGTGRSAGFWSGAGVFVSCVALEIVGAASATIPGSNSNPTALFTSHMSTAVADITLIAIAFGAICANALNVYSGVMSFLATGIRMPLKWRRAIVALGFGSIGFVVAGTGLHNAGTDYENFLLVIAYWIGPWLGVFFTDWLLRRGQRIDGFLFDRKHNPWSGAAAMLIGMAVSIPLFSNQTEFVGLIVKHNPSIGDLTFEVGFVVSALLYWLFFSISSDRRSEALVIPDEALVIPDAAT
ncbi:MAG TPA: cytosine permease [Solirubrobacteraceae bacterium]|nr:cytosine permease [Solirubrobacteraceae bacterium]